MPPCLVVLLRRDLTAEDLPAPLIDQQSKGQKCNLLQRFVQQEAHVLRWVGRSFQKAELYQVFRCHRKRDSVAYSLMETVVRAIAEKERLRVVGALIEIVAELVVNDGEIFAGDV